MKRIVISTYDDIKNPHYGGGGAAVIHKIAKRLSKDYIVTIISWNHSGRKEERVDGVYYRRIGYRSVNPKIGMLIYPILILYSLLAEKYDLWIENTTPPFSFSILPLVSREKIFSWVNMLSADDMQRKYGLPFVNYIERILSLNYKYFIVTSNWTKNYIKNNYGNKKASFCILSNGIDKLPVIKRNTTQDYILYIGRLEINQKGLDLLISAFSKINKKLNVKLVIAGNGSSKEIKEIKNLVKLNGISEQVELVGRVSGYEKEKLYSECLVLALPSRFDTYPLVVLEAFSYSKPVVLFDLPRLSWIPKDASLKVSCFDEKKYSKALNDLIANKKLREHKGRAGRDFVKNKTWDRLAKKLDTFINKNI